MLSNSLTSTISIFFVIGFSMVFSIEAAGSWCQDYAWYAIDANRDNISLSCNFSGPRWQSNSDAHYEWCQKVPESWSKNEFNVRWALLKVCRRERIALQCDAYAKNAINQYEENIRNNCGLSGDRWQPHYDNHLTWCLLFDAGPANNETNARTDELRRCTSKSIKAIIKQVRCSNGQCTVSAMGLRPNQLATVLVTDDALNRSSFQQTASKNGTLDDFTFGLPCLSGYRLHFIVSSALFSAYDSDQFTTTCP